jgi:hypothetical protein
MRNEAHNLSTLAARLVRVATPSMLLAAACGTTPPHGGHGGAAGAAGTTSARPLPPPPPFGRAEDGGVATGYPQCYGEGSQSSGPCCLNVRCVEPPDGGTACKAPSAIVPSDVGYVTFGSGSCLCQPITGLYTQATAQAYSPSQGPCCYLVPIQSCIGRPLILEGRDVTAPLAFSSGWV